MSWLEGWTYRKSITLSRASGAVTNYQMKLLVGESSGAVGEDVDCGGLCATDFDDLRFTAADGTTLLDYWIESVTGTTPNQLATVWIEFDSIGTGATTFYMYYGNSGASAVSNGQNTFVAFDDFEWGADEDNIDTSGGGITWSKTTAGTSTAKIDTAQAFSGTRSLRLHRDGSNNPNAYFSKTAGTNYAIRWRFRKDDTSAATIYHGNGSKLLYAYADASENIYANGIDTGQNASINSWQLYEVTDINHATPKFDLWFEGNKAADNAGMLTNAGAANQIRFDNEAGTSDIWVDNVAVRQWDATEPAWGSWGSREQQAEGSFSDVIGIGDAADGFSMAGTIGDSAGIGDTADAYNMIGTVNESIGFGDSISTEVELSVSVSDTGGVSDLADAGFEYDGAIAEAMGLGDSADAFSWTAWLSANRDRSVIRYYCTLTGAADGLSDLVIPIASFQASKRTGESTYLSVAVPGVAQAEEIADRSNGEIVIHMAYLLDGVESLREEILRVELEQINPQEGARSRSITLIGHKTVTYDARSVSVQGCNYKYTSGGSRGFRFPQADPYLNPGDALTVVDTEDVLTVDYITYAISARGAKFMEVREG